MQRKQPLQRAHGGSVRSSARMDTRDRHLKLLTDTIEAVNSTLDLEEVLSQVATKVADALHADACFVYLYDEQTAELVLRATHGTSVEEMTQRPRMRPGEGITGAAAEDRVPVMIPTQAHLDPRFKNFPNLRRGRVRVDPGGADPRARRAAGGRAERAHPRLPRVQRGRDRPAARDRGPGGAVDRAREAVRGGAAPRARARGARPHLRGGLRVALPRGVARGDREDDDGRALRHGRRARARGRLDRLAGGPSRRARDPVAASLARTPDRRARRRPRLRRSRSTTTSCSRRSRSRLRSRSSTAAP